jgi:hypothetical protein
MNQLTAGFLPKALPAQVRIDAGMQAINEP